MISVKLTTEHSDGIPTYGLHVTGHAQYAKRGEDIICAAASMLVQAAYKALSDLDDELTERLHTDGFLPGFATFSVTPTELGFERVYGILSVCKAGFTQLCEQYPDYVALSLEH